MIALKVEDVKTFTSKLFLKEDFDSFLVKEVNIVTYNNFTIDGHIRQGYYTDEELEENRIESFSSCSEVRRMDDVLNLCTYSFGSSLRNI